MPYPSCRIALDPGFGSFKAATIVADGRPAVAIVPSVVGVGRVDIGLLSVGHVGPRKSREKPLLVSFDGISYLVGEGVAAYARPVERMDFLCLADGPELRALLYATVCQILPAEPSPAALLIGLPVEVLAERSLALETLRGLRSWLVAAHDFTVDDRAIHLEVTAVEVLAQPAGAFFAWGLDAAGRWARSTADLKAAVGVCDIGFNTTDLFTVQGGQVLARFTGGDTLGVRRAAELLAQSIRGSHGVKFSLHEVDALLRQRRPALYLADGEVSIVALARQALETAADAIIALVEQRWGNGRQFAHLLFTGGGAELLREALLRHYPHGVVLPDPVTANAVGLARYAQRPGVFPV